MGGLERIQFNVMLIRVMNIYYSGSNISHLIQSEIYITYKKNQNKRGGEGERRKKLTKEVELD
ncbi:hypothetical protein JHK82_056850 [Glycine max]|nr:hypothetical protein JHK86_056682 [Glycine max]KAG4910837.1 hypothetical protein JHK87_056953 [Glycine soja]KAG5075493.1 hypothetical protein JHK84_056724 [Glycine max]KAG5078155.1 hypothetical protein JHK82_056850 [Glycine max]